MTDSISSNIINLSKRISNLEEQRSIITETVDRINLFFESIGLTDSLLKITTKINAETLTVTDSLSTDTGTELAETAGEFILFRFDYDRFDYGRFSYQGPDSQVSIITN
jgi:alcohol dehydrogenase YqhD (iron-dependent ADH family)